ncbi:MAG TPA: sigma 54-interacting transcriptional regulator [Polyangiaceae bacterium]
MISRPRIERGRPNDAATVGATHDGDAPIDPKRGLLLVVMEHGALARYDLPATGSLRIGRADSCDIVLRDPAASRLHAVLTIGETVELEDAGSHNGTRVRNEWLRTTNRARVGIGDAIRIGEAILIVQAAPRDSLFTAHPKDTSSVQHGVIVRDPAMQEVYDLVRRVAPSSLSVLVLGETGSGKEVIAAAVHDNSGARSRGPFVRVNCAAIAETLFESELFGHERGAFTGAVRSKQGLLESAQGGSVFLDEVGELPLPAQAKLLRVLESRELTRVGGVKAQTLDVRFVCATNRDLQQEIARGSFREDLFFRLAGVTICLPPLRDRPSELEPLIDEFVAAFSAQLERTPPRVSDGAFEILRRYTWPGNIRELRSVLESATLRSNGVSIEPADLPDDILEPSRTLRPNVETSVPTSGPETPDSPEPAGLTPRQREERERIIRALTAFSGNQTRAAEHLAMPRRTLVTKLGVYGIPRPRKTTPVPRA